MLHIDFLLDRFASTPDQPAIVWRSRSVTYRWLRERIHHLEAGLEDRGIRPGSVVSLAGDFSPTSISLFLALAARSCIICPVLRTASDNTRRDVATIAQVEHVLEVGEDDEISGAATGVKADYAFYRLIRDRGHPGLVLFTSGSAGRPKAAVHDLSLLLEKFRERRSPMKILNFLLFDHWGGLNTMLHTLSSSGTVFTVQERSPDAICSAIQEHGIEVLPASPTFLNLLLLSNAHRRHDLGTLRTISYGTEPMPETTLRRIREAFPHVLLHQTYGLIELGVLRSKSKSNDSLWVKIGGEGYETRVVDGMLQIRARSAMLGYLNAPSPFTEDGWFETGDAVEVEDGFFRILGRKSELINVGGEKVYPQEVESVIQEVPNIAEVTVYGERSPLVGNIVCARVRLVEAEDPKLVSQRVKTYCRERFPRYKVPVKIEVVDERQHGDRFKKRRATEPV